MGRAASGAFTHEGLRYLPVRPDALDPCTLPLDLFLRHEEGAPVLYRSAGLAFTPGDLQRLASNGVGVLFISASQHGVFRQMLGERLTRLIADPGVGRDEAARRIRALCAGVIEGVLAAPGEPEAVHAVAEVSGHLARWAGADAEALAFLLDMSAHDFYTATHMINVGIGCGVLYRRLRPGDADSLSAVIQGGLLHDIGKRGVPESILSKVGPLNAAEWQIVRRHPRLAYEELREHPGVPDVVLAMARDHHERLDGRGYPNELAGAALIFEARLCAVVDVYDALTSNRQYRRALAPRQALAILAQGSGTHFDPVLLDAWHTVVEGLAQARRLAGPGAPPARLTLDAFLPHCELSGIHDRVA